MNPLHPDLMASAAAVGARSARWDLPWLRSYDPGVPFSIDYPNRPVFGLLEDAARTSPSHVAVRCMESTLTYAELLERSHRFAHALIGLGVRRGTRVGIHLPNVPEYVVALAGTWMAGGTVVQLSPLMVEEEIDKVLEATNCQVVVSLDILTAPLHPLLARGRIRHLIVASLGPRVGPLDRWLYPIELLRRGLPWRSRPDRPGIDFDELLAGQPSHAPRVRIDPGRDAAVIQPTGGTTGTPKAAVLTHRNLMANSLQLRAWHNAVDGRDTVLAVVPFFHCYGLTVVLLASMASRDTLVLCPRFKPRVVARLIERTRPSILPAVPALYAAMNRYMERHPVDLSSIELSVSAASALDPEVRRRFEAHGARSLVEAYGLSEASPATHVNPVARGNRPGTVGLPLPDTLARVVDLDTGTRDLPAGQPGELVVRGPQVMAGYLDDAAETARVIRDGWLFTGDVATYDHDGYFRIVDRKKDLIKTSGYNVFPIEVEEVLRRHPAVSDVAVVGVPHAERGEIVKAFIVARPGSVLSRAEIDRFCGEHLAKHKQPRDVELCQDLPRNFLGKVLRRKLREPE